jgi:TolB-like protein/tRNA A-37 threonylcarbamoyl transferase component Bud32/tetratricopeptide (TPR) repeat protein
MPDLLSRVGAALAGRYTIERELGRGGMATVYLAADLKHARRVAVKVLDPELAGSIGPERFLQEIQIAARLTHPNILPLHDSGEADGLLYYVMPYIEGESLRDRLERERHLGLEETTQIVRGVAAALSHAHERGVIHRDIKPENILLAGGQAVVADFGIARAIDAAGSDRLTATGLAIGTPAYMSPEQVSAERALDGRADIYSLGCVAYEMLGGEPPFTGPSAQAVMARQATDPVPRLRTLRPGVPEGVQQAVERALAKVPADRFATADDFAAALARAGTAEAIAADRNRARRRRRGRAAGVLAGAVVVAAAVWRLSGLSGATTIQRFAVLPFDNPVADPRQEYFVDGVHDALISELAREGLGVIARTSVLQYRHSAKAARVIARELGADALVETSFARTPDSVTIRARLVDGRTEQYLWSASFAAPLAQVPALARRVAHGIALAVNPTRERAAAAPVGRQRPVDPDAYDAYLKGEFHLHRPGRAELDSSRKYFELALAKDSTYAPAYAGISAVWGVGRQRGYYSPQESTPPSEAAAYTAIRLDSTIAEPHFVLAEMKMYGEWDFRGADREFRRAIALRPDYAEARAFYAHLLCVLQRPKEAIAQTERARELDPFNPLFGWIGGATFTLLRRYDDAIAILQETAAKSPNDPRPLWILWVTLHNAGRHAEAYREVVRWARVMHDSVVASALDRGHARAGYAGAMRAVADLMVARAQHTYVDAWDIAIWYAAAGDNDKALDWLERAYLGHDPTMPYLAVHPSMRQLRDYPRYQDLLRKMNLPG